MVNTFAKYIADTLAIALLFNGRKFAAEPGTNFFVFFQISGRWLLLVKAAFSIHNCRELSDLALLFTKPPSIKCSPSARQKCSPCAR